MRPPAIELGTANFWSKVVPNVENLNRLYEQADVSIPFDRFMWIVGGLAAVGGIAAAVLGPHPLLAPVGAAVLGGMPFLWLNHRKNKRRRKFLEAMPEAVELIGRAPAPATGSPPGSSWSPRR